MSFDTTGKMHIVYKTDGMYVVGEGMLIPIDSEEEGKQIIESCTKKEE